LIDDEGLRNTAHKKTGYISRFFLRVRQAWRVARKRNQLGCGGLAGDLEVKVLYTPGKGKC
jgi:hypothetical protein